jgi:asparagine synthase (glutamine-hydrolysing)
MCGIAGLWGREDKATIAEMMRRLVHRGPDAKGMHSDDRGTLGHQRLSIMDPTGGDQPIYSGDGQRVILGNGEIYNFPGLRKQYESKHTFRTRSDTEIALHLWEDLATSAAGRLDGMFALAIADGPDLYLARDPIGIKPLYVGTSDDGLVFGSELKAMVGHAENVEEFPAGHWFHPKHGYRKFYGVPDRWVEERSVEEHRRLLRDTLERAVEKRMMSDVPVGSFLSGGLDSSVIAAMIRRQVDELHTFSVGIEGSDDLAAARLVADHIDSIHHEYVFTMDEVIEKLPEIVYHLESFDQDLVRSAIPCYFTSRLAARYVKVIHTGEGADELFAGYTYYKGVPDEKVLHDELRRSVASLHNVNLQRVDRLTMAHSLEGRVPFLDTELIELAMTIPADLKLLRGDNGQLVEKWILRKACEDLLPDEIVWRKKAQFDEGSGTVDLVSGGLEKYQPAEGHAAYAARYPRANLRSAEECAYHALLMDAYDGSPVVMDNVGRWADRPDHIEPADA